MVACPISSILQQLLSIKKETKPAKILRLEKLTMFCTLCIMGWKLHLTTNLETKCQLCTAIPTLYDNNISKIFSLSTSFNKRLFYFRKIFLTTFGRSSVTLKSFLPEITAIKHTLRDHYLIRKLKNGIKMEPHKNLKRI